MAEKTLDLATIFQNALTAYLREELPGKVKELQDQEGTKPPEMIPLRTVCQRTGLSWNYVRYEMLKNDKVKYIVLGKRNILVNWQSVIDYLNTGDGIPDQDHS